MAKVKLSPRNNLGDTGLFLDMKIPAFDAGITFYRRKGGTTSVRIRPAPKSYRPSEKQKRLGQWLHYSAQLYKVQAAALTYNYQRQSHGLWLQPRDIFTAALAGRLFSIGVEGGTVYPWRAKRDMSTALDVLIQSKGGLIYRGASFWEGLTAGAVGDRLGISADGLPAWSPVASAADDRSSFFCPSGAWYSATQGQSRWNTPLGDLVFRFNSIGTYQCNWTVEVPQAGGTCEPYILLYGESGAPGDYRWEFDWAIQDATGAVGATTTTVSFSASIPAGSRGRHILPALTVGAESSRRFLLMGLRRTGAHALDTSGAHVSLSAIGGQFV